ncbi:nuclear body protein SP140 isoform X1 [Xenopus laevis]|nr:nuclear body protein SP140 isoform X1 [Xenopus laevis]XP_018119364.1 nuclear body protein SP140 isoform X1 [Xenopus laevis]XP_041419369.1 nuclear body protein SP140 isoform X1 [Xenopus laevis]XP_041419370.1 nuclear body protein SP140 isoform X1 [Xenopus laevis]XP_041419371.1 nuclear body protein SP140 isoform X1 [Xenopus laevis]OCT81026.1 hypothetical protein XELAEV_18027841mg [Xenopus laevis]
MENKGQRAADSKQLSQKFKMFRKKKKKIPKGILTSSSLSVTCGDKVGILHKDKLCGGSTKCIFSNGIWMTPNEFQKHGRCQSYKNWKISIRCEGICLKELMRERYLNISKLPQTSKAKKNLEAPELPQTSKAVSNEDSNVDANKTVKLATSDVVPVQYTLPVSCGDFEGTLHVNRFGQGNCGKCIRTSNRWCTPLQFLALSGVPDSNTWDAQICVRGEPLNTLLQKKLLSLHDAGCCCDICTDCDSSQQNDDECSVCGDGGDLLCCEECPRAFHSNCHEPSTTAMESFSEPWICTFCKMQQMRKHSEPQQLLSCQYFLLHVLCDPNNELSIIQSKPKELDLLKKRLHEMEGGSGECPWNFISDVILTVIGAYPPQKREKVRGLLEKEFNQLMLS